MTRRSRPSSPQLPQGSVARYRSRIFDDPRHDPYAATQTYRSPTCCPTCGAAYLRGSWRWADAPQAAAAVKCPACRRIEDDMPAGIVKVEGEFVRAHRDEVVGTLRNEAERERLAHPMNRLIAVSDTPEGLQASTTDIHSPQRIGEALRSAYQGELNVRYGEDEYSVQVTWRR